jgi:hypothetical protein
MAITSSLFPPDHNVNQRTVQSNSPLLRVLLRVLDPAATGDDRLLGDLIRTLGHSCLYRPAQTSDCDLEALLAVSVALNLMRRRERLAG